MGGIALTLAELRGVELQLAREADLRALRAFTADYPMARALLLCGVERRTYREPGIELWPLASALQSLGALLSGEVPAADA